MNFRMVRSSLGFLVLSIATAFFMTAVHCGGTTTPPVPPSVTVTAKLVLPDGTEKALTDTPLPLNLRIQLTFSEAVDRTEAEGLLSLMADGRNVRYTVTWNEGDTVMTVRPNDRLDYQTAYSVDFQGDAATDAFSGEFATMLRNDVNGDGKADVFATAQYWPGGGDNGRAYLFYGEGIGNASAGDAAFKIDGAATDLLAGFGIVDINDDGYGDLYAIVYIGAGHKGVAYIFYGGPGTEPLAGTVNATQADLILSGADNDNYFVIRGLGDVNDDGYTDMVAGASGCNGDTGCVYVFLGPDFETESASDADIIITGEQISDNFGSGIRVSDVNGDGVEDIICDAIGYDLDAPNLNVGRIYVFYGGSDLTSASASDADIKIDGENTGDTFKLGEVGDLDGDGLMDIVGVSTSYSSDKGRVYLFYAATLASGSAAAADIKITGEQDNDLLGLTNHPFVGDVNADGKNDFLVSSYFFNGKIGRIYVFLGGTTIGEKNAGEADIIFTGEPTNDSFRLTEIGDVNGDGVDDLIAYAPDYSGGGYQGRSYIFFGSASLADMDAEDADIILTGEDDDDSFGISRLLDVNGDGILDVTGSAYGFPGGDSKGKGYIFYGGSGLTGGSAASADVAITGEANGDEFVM